MKNRIKQIPILGWIAKYIYGLFVKKGFTTSNHYWENRYSEGGNSGEGSYNKLAEFKADIINTFVQKNNIESVIEFGCGDGNQLKYFNFKKYLGIDISQVIIDKCIKQYSFDNSKQFINLKELNKQKAELTLSLDVIYHLIEVDVYETYMNNLFSSSIKYVIIYSSNQTAQTESNIMHIKHRKFTDWIELNMPKYELISNIPNIYKGDGLNGESSFADFFIYEKND